MNQENEKRIERRQSILAGIQSREKRADSPIVVRSTEDILIDLTQGGDQDLNIEQAFQLLKSNIRFSLNAIIDFEFEGLDIQDRPDRVSDLRNRLPQQILDLGVLSFHAQEQAD